MLWLSITNIPYKTVTLKIVIPMPAQGSPVSRAIEQGCTRGFMYETIALKMRL